MSKSHKSKDEPVFIPEPEVPAPVDKLECPVCHIRLRRSNCGKGPYCQHMIPLEAPCKECKSKYNDRIFWNCPKCNYMYADVPPAVDWRISNIPRVKKKFLVKLPEEK